MGILHAQTEMGTVSLKEALYTVGWLPLFIIVSICEGYKLADAVMLDQQFLMQMQQHQDKSNLYYKMNSIEVDLC